MTLQQVLAQQHEHFEAECHDANLILLHPMSPLRSALVAHLLRFSRRPTFYHALRPEDIDVYSFINSLLRSLTYQQAAFGRHLSLIDPNPITPPPIDHLEALADALAQDLNDLHDTNYYLILDEFDRCDESDDIYLLIDRLIDRTPAHCHLILNSRTYPRLSWIARIASRRAVVFADDDIVTQQFYADQRSASCVIRLDALSLGPGFVLLNDHPIEAWEGHLPRLLLFFTLERPWVTRSEVCAAFWPDLRGEQAVNVFHVTKRRLHKAFCREITGFEILTHHDGRYRINGAVKISCDAEAFAEALLCARMSPPEERAAYLAKAIDLYRGPYLQGQHEDWIVRRRKDYQTGFVEALKSLAAIRKAEQRTEVALQYLLRAANICPTDLDLHQDIIHTYLSLGRRSEASLYLNRLIDMAEAGTIKLPISFIQQQRIIN